MENQQKSCTRSAASMLYPIALILMTVAFGLKPIADWDIWWHLKTGEIITILKSIPNFDLFSYTAIGANWVNHEWLSQVVFWLIYKAYSFNGLVLLELGLTFFIILFSYLTTKRLTGSKILGLWGTLIILMAIGDRIIMRPYLFGYALLSFELYALHSYSHGKANRLIWLIPIFQLIWTNLHAGAILGEVLIIGFWLGERFQKIINAPDPLADERIRNLGAIALVSLAMTFLNPNIKETILFPNAHLGMDNIIRYTSEWIPSFYQHLDQLTAPTVYKILLPATFISFLVNSKKVKFSELFVALLVGYLSLKSKRFNAKFAIVCIPIMISNFKFAFANKGFKNRYFEIINIAIIVAISTLIFNFGYPFTLNGSLFYRSSFGFDRYFAPKDVVDFLDENKVEGKIFNDMAYGGYLIFKSWPKRSVFIDGRTPVYGDKFYEQYVNAIRNPLEFQKLDLKYDFDCAILKIDSLDMKRQGIMLYLMNTPPWRLVFKSDSSIIFLKKR